MTDIADIPRLATTHPYATDAMLEKRWKPGQSGNPGGKPVGARNRLQGEFMRRLADDFDRFGIYAIARVRRHDPAAYLRVIASLMPKEIDLKRSLDEFSDDALDAAALAIRAILDAQADRAGEAEAQGREPVSELPALPQTG